MKLAVITGAPAAQIDNNTPNQSQWIVKQRRPWMMLYFEHVDIADYQMPFINEAISPPL